MFDHICYSPTVVPSLLHTVTRQHQYCELTSIELVCDP